MENRTDLNALLSTLSNNPALLGMLSGLMSGASGGTSHETPPPKPPHPTPTQGLDPDLLSALGNLISGSADRGSTPSSASPEANTPTVNEAVHRPTNPGASLQKMLGGKAECENRIRLLHALRPYLSEERRQRLDLLLRLLKLAEIGQLSGLLNSL